MARINVDLRLSLNDRDLYNRPSPSVCVCISRISNICEYVRCDVTNPTTHRIVNRRNIGKYQRQNYLLCLLFHCTFDQSSHSFACSIIIAYIYYIYHIKNMYRRQPARRSRCAGCSAHRNASHALAAQSNGTPIEWRGRAVDVEWSFLCGRIKYSQLDTKLETYTTIRAE